MHYLGELPLEHKCIIIYFLNKYLDKGCFSYMVFNFVKIVILKELAALIDPEHWP